MDRRTAKEYVHIRDWLLLAQRVVDQGEEAYIGDPLLQEPGPSISPTKSIGTSPGRR